MKAPIYETSNGALQTLLSTREFMPVDLYTFTLAQGTTLRYAAFERDVTFSGATWSAGDALFDLDSSPARGHWKAGTDVDTWVVRVAPRAKDPLGNAYPDRINGTPWLAAVRAGALDKALVAVLRAYFPKTARIDQALSPTLAPTGVLQIFGGWVAEIDLTTTYAIVNINSFMDILSDQLPRNVYEPACRHTLYGIGCGLAASAFQVAGSVLAASSTSTLSISAGTPAGSGTYVLGKVRLTSGANTGFTRTIRSVSGSSFKLLCPFPFPVEAGASALLYPGCAKTIDACAAFGNKVNFPSMPFIPAQETAV
jgi:hypothetical protein